LELAVDTIGGSALRFVRDTLGIPVKAIQDEKVEMSKIPFIRRIAGDKSEWADSKVFYKNMEDIYVTEERLKAYKGTEEYRNIVNNTKFERSLIPLARSTESTLKSLRKRLKVAQINNNKNAIDRFTEAIKRTYVMFNKRYSQMKKRYQ